MNVTRSWPVDGDAPDLMDVPTIVPISEDDLVDDPQRFLCKLTALTNPDHDLPIPDRLRSLPAVELIPMLLDTAKSPSTVPIPNAAMKFTATGVSILATSKGTVVCSWQDYRLLVNL